MRVQPLDLTGQKFNKLTAIKRIGKDKYGTFVWLFKCECGNEKEIQGTCVKNGKTKSCGCLVIERIKETNTIHGQANNKIFSIWRGMKKRCYEEKSPSYKTYGAKGIKVCDEWMDFTNFYNWSLENGYDESLTIDRIDPSENYEPNNCRWVTNITQQNNKRNNVLIELDGHIKTLAEWSRFFGTENYLARNRKALGREGYALFVPKQKRGNGYDKSLEEKDIERMKEMVRYQGEV